MLGLIRLENRAIRIAIFAMTLAILAAAPNRATEPVAAESETCKQESPQRNRVGEFFQTSVSTPHPYRSDQTYEFHQPGATYIKVHFSRFELAPGDRVIVSSPDGRERYVFFGKGYKQKGENFWVNSVLGDRAIVQLQSVNGDGYGFDVDHFAYGVEPIFPPAPTSVCGANDWNDVACYEDSFPTEFERAKSAVVVLFNGVENCSGVKVGCPNQFLTNEHCVTSQAEVDATEVRFEYQNAACGGGGSSFSQSYLGDQFIADGFTQDYCLFTAEGNSNTYEAAELDPRLPPAGERMYITGHPAGSPKKLSVIDTSNGTGLCQVDFSPVDGRGPDSDFGYFCDTTGGSSGSPVWSGETHKVIGLHHFGGCPNSAGRMDFIFNEIGDLIASCCETEPNVPTLAAQSGASNEIDLTWDDSALPTVVGYELKRSRNESGPYELIATIPDSSPGAGNGAGYSYVDTDVSGGTTYYYTVQSTDGEQCTSDASTPAQATATGACTLPPIFNGIQGGSAPNNSVCTIELFWQPATAECGSSVSYNVYRSTQEGFVPGISSLLASGITGTAYVDIDQLVQSTPYFYRVQAVDTSNASEDSNDQELRIVPSAGPGQPACTTGSACADNPFVDVTPDGPMTVCQGGGPELTASLNGGSGNFEYQWVRDGIPIPGATSASYTPNDLGTHSYNVLVSAASCEGSVFDGLDTQLSRVNQPFFDGIVSATDPQNSTDCTVDLAWNAATSACPGPVEYYVYRDTVSPVAMVPQNLIASALGGTGYSDTAGLESLSTYYYAVLSRDASTGQFDSNTQTASATPAGPGNGFIAVFSDDFNDGSSFSQWTVTTGPGAHNCGEWILFGPGTGNPPGGSSGNFAMADGTCNGQLLPLTSTTLESPSIDLDIPNALSVSLEAKVEYDTANGDDASIQVWDGSQWVTVWTDPNGFFDQQVSIDVTAEAAGNSDFRVRFDYQNSNADERFSIDDVQVIVEREVSCATVALGPPSAGSLIADRAPGGEIGLNWDTSCSATDYNLVYGSLSAVASHTIDGSICDLGTGGSYDWAGVPAGDLYYLIVGTDGNGTESSWGRDSALTERGGAVSGQCGASDKQADNVCLP